MPCCLVATCEDVVDKNLPKYQQNVELLKSIAKKNDIEHFYLTSSKNNVNVAEPFVESVKRLIQYKYYRYVRSVNK